MSKTLVAWAGVLLLAACKDKTAPEPPNAFTAEILGAVNDTITGVGLFASGSASLNFVRLDGSDGGTFVLQYEGSTDRWPVGTHQIAGTDNAALVFFTEGFTGTATSGSVTITSSSTHAVAGTFTATLEGSSAESEGEQVTVSGTFRAKCGFLPGRACTDPE